MIGVVLMHHVRRAVLVHVDDFMWRLMWVLGCQMHVHAGALRVQQRAAGDDGDPELKGTHEAGIFACAARPGNSLTVRDLAPLMSPIATV